MNQDTGPLRILQQLWHATSMDMAINENDNEFLRALHNEKIRTQNERSALVIRKMTFIAISFAISSVNIGIKIEDIFWLLYFVPMIAVCHDLYIMSADLRIKRIGIFLGMHPVSAAGNPEREWENFCTFYRDSLAPSANIFFSITATLGAAVFIHAQQTWMRGSMQLWFAVWLVASLTIIIALWTWHKTLIRSIGNYEPI